MNPFTVEEMNLLSIYRGETKGEVTEKIAFANGLVLRLENISVKPNDHCHDVKIAFRTHHKIAIPCHTDDYLRQMPPALRR